MKQKRYTGAKLWMTWNTRLDYLDMILQTVGSYGKVRSRRVT